MSDLRKLLEVVVEEISTRSSYTKEGKWLSWRDTPDTIKEATYRGLLASLHNLLIKALKDDT